MCSCRADSPGPPAGKRQLGVLPLSVAAVSLEPNVPRIQGYLPTSQGELQPKRQGHVDSANLGLGQACQGNMKHALHLTKSIGV